MKKRTAKIASRVARGSIRKSISYAERFEYATMKFRAAMIKMQKYTNRYLPTVRVSAVRASGVISTVPP